MVRESHSGRMVKGAEEPGSLALVRGQPGLVVANRYSRVVQRSRRVFYLVVVVRLELRDRVHNLVDLMYMEPERVHTEMTALGKQGEAIRWLAGRVRLEMTEAQKVSTEADRVHRLENQMWVCIGSMEELTERASLCRSIVRVRLEGYSDLAVPRPDCGQSE
jgi:hypothetical protein